MSDVEMVNKRMHELCDEQRFVEAAQLVTGLPEGDLISGPYFDLWWHICEDLGDAVKNDRPALAVRLYSKGRRRNNFSAPGAISTASVLGNACCLSGLRPPVDRPWPQ